MNLNDFFSKPSRIKEAYTNNYPSYTPPAASSDSDSDPTFDRLTGEPKFDRFAKTVSDPVPDVGDAEAEPEFMVEPNKYVQSWAPKSSIAPNGWRYVEKDEDPARYSSGSAAAAPSPSSKSASASGLPKMRFDIASQRLVPVDQPIALDLSPKNSNIKSGSNPNIDADTRARALAWAARKNAPTAVTPAAAVVPPAAKPTAVTPAAAVVPPAAKPTAVTPPAASLKDLPAEKPSSWKDIAQANGIANPNRIMPGQTLKIPGRADYVVKPGDTLADIAAGQTKAPKSAPSPGDTQPAAVAVLKKYPNLGTLAPIPRDVLKDLGMDAQTKKEIAKYGREELLTPAIIKQQNYSPTPAQALAALRAGEKANTERIAARDAEREANRKKVKEDDIEEQTMDDGFKWGSPTMPMQDGSVHKYNPQTNSYSQASPPTKPNLNTSMSTITRDRTTDKNGQANSDFGQISIATNPATGTGDYMHQQDVNGVAKTTFRQNVPADELAKLRTGAGIPPAQQAVKESLDRMQSLAGIRKK